MRRLAAILAADVVGFSRLMGQDEGGTLARLKTLRVQVLQPLIAEHRGRVVKLMGDGLLVEFASVVEAVTCAVAWQERVTTWDAGNDEEPFQFRIGINLGDVMVEEDDLYGDGVNIAKRLEGQAEPGGICLSEDTYRQVKGKVQVSFEDLGPRILKNIAGSMRIYRIDRGAAAASGNVGIARAHRKPSLAVIPFANLSGDPEREYFSDGVTEDIITELSRFRSLFVVAPNSSFRYRHQNVNMQDVGRQLGVEYIVQGSVRKGGDRLRITTQLVHAESGQHVWAERYDCEMEDIFQVQDDVVRRITSTLVGRLEDARHALAQRQPWSDLRAYDIYLRARQHFVNLSLEDNRKAAQLLERVIDIEPDYAAAWALRSEVYLRDWLNGWNDNLDFDLAKAYRVALEAVELDEHDSRTHTALALTWLYSGEHDRARHHLDIGVRLNPNDPRVLVWYSRYAVFNGDPHLAIDFANRALALDPFGKYHINLGITAFVARQYDLAVEQLSSVRNPPVYVLAMLAGSFAMSDRMDEARSTAERFVAVAQTAPALRGLEDITVWQNFFVTRWPFRCAEDRERFLAALRKAGLRL
jgi:adenylate cyclase